MTDNALAASNDACEVVMSPVHYELRVFDRRRGQSWENKTGYSFGLNVTDMGFRECRLHLALGSPPMASLPLIMRELLQRGFEVAYMETSRRAVFTRFATAVGKDGGQTRYRIDIRGLLNRIDGAV